MLDHRILKRLSLYIQIMRLDKPVGIWLLLWPSLIGLWVAFDGHIQWSLVIIFVLGSISMRSAGCVINDIVDRDLDIYVIRTKQRPLANSKLHIIEAYILFGVLLTFSLYLAFFLNSLTIKMAFIGATLACIYPWMKRMTYFPQLFLGVTFAWASVMAVTAITKSLPLYTWPMFLAIVLWVMSFDTAYALVDFEDDKKIGIKSTALLFKHNTPKWILIWQIISVVFFIYLAYIKSFNIIFYIGIILISILTYWQMKWLKSGLKRNYFKVFLSHQYFGAIIFASLVLATNVLV